MPLRPKSKATSTPPRATTISPSRSSGPPLPPSTAPPSPGTQPGARPWPPRWQGTFQEHPPDTVAGMSNHATTVATAVQLLNAGDVHGYVTTLYHPDAAFHGFPPDFPADRDGITAFFRALRAGIPDATIAAQDLLTDQDRVAVRFTLTGTHTGELFGVPASGART